jgi:hypothetical protein
MAERPSTRPYPERCPDVRLARSLALQSRELERRIKSLQRRLRLLEQPPKRCRACSFAVNETCELYAMRKEQAEAAMQEIVEADGG